VSNALRIYVNNALYSIPVHYRSAMVMMVMILTLI